MKVFSFIIFQLIISITLLILLIVFQTYHYALYFTFSKVYV